MTDFVIDAVRDAWVNENRAGLNYGSASGVRIKSGSPSHYAFLLPDLPNLAGATILDAYLVARGAAALSAQTITVSPVTERWAPGRVTWNKKPAVNSGAAVGTAISATSSADASVTLTGLGPMIQAVADGTDWYGLRLTTSVTSDQRFRSSDSGSPSWELHITVSESPEVPTNLRPDGGAVPDATPTLGWDYYDFGGSTEQAELRVQVDTPTGGADPDDVTPDYDSGWEPEPDPQWALAGEHTLVGSGPHYWRVNVKDADGNESGWSDWAEFDVAAHPSLVVDSPVGSFSDPSPTLTAHLSTGGTVKAWQAWATGPDRSDVRAESGMSTGTISWTVPERNSRGRRVFREDEQGWLYLRVWDSVDRAPAVGQPTYVDVWIEADWDQDGGVDAPTGLLVQTQFVGDPRLRWQWSRTEAADAWLIQVDGVTVARLEPEDVTADAGTYTWTDSGHVSPQRPHTLAVRAVEGATVSPAVSVAGQVFRTDGLWLIPEADIDPVVVFDTRHGAFTRVDRLASYTPLVGPEVDVIYDVEGRRSEVEGVIFRNMGAIQQDVWDAVAALEALQDSRVRTARMVWGSQSIRVRVRDVDVTSHDDNEGRRNLHVVRFGFVEVG